MAQAKVDEYFTTRKRNSSVQPSKRRKVVLSLNTNESPQSFSDSSVTSDTISKEKNEFTTTCLRDSTLKRATKNTNSKSKELPYQSHEDIFRFKAKPETIALDKHQNPSTASKGRNNKSRADKTETSVRHQPTVTVTDLFSKQKSSLNQLSETQTVKPTSKLDSRTETLSEEVTSEWDDSEGNVLNTPRKRKINHETIVSKLPKTVPKQPKFTETEAAEGIKANLYSNNSESAKTELLLPIDEVEAGQSETSDDVADKEVSQFLYNKSQLLALVSEVMIKPPDHAVSPLLSLSPSVTKETEKSLTPVSSIPKLQDKQKLMALKDRLKKCGKVSELKEKLGDLKKSLNEVKEHKAVHKAAKQPIVSLEKDQVQADRLPAFQRFQYLGEPGPPTLSLPHAFKILEENFQAMDQVVSMLHNRTEICTFSKLKAAVQNITRKNFEEKAVAQIKTVVPDAYIFRQEKNIPSLLQQTNGYQLTIEPNLQSEEASNSSKECPKTSGGKPVFSASMLIKRKRWFSNNLIAYLKQLHKAFLATLNPPLEVSDDQLMRWHPRFQLDKVDVTLSQLPQSPDVKIYRTAKDVLENQRGKLNPMVEKALSKVVEKDLMANKNNTSLATNSLQQLSSNSKSNQTVDSIKGIPPALLAKIRAKEAKKIEESLIRKPEEDIKLKIMNRLPEVIRTLRAIFVTEKKPALPLEDVCKKLEENYKNGISQRDVEQHVNMLRELAPELISVVEIKRGKYLKFDKNVDVQAVSSRIMNLVKFKK
ncbi:unnamed protein product [Lymnaea stagnalis]|uniref:CDT1 Geminin-binding domain-containing protein n=1 Tax=Lymnaea stagnalis TaxID=6523 RepID=A0AAV2HG49_LYMST